MKWRIASIVLIVLLVTGGCVGVITATSLESELNERETSYASLQVQYISLLSDFEKVQNENARLEGDLTIAQRTIDKLQKLAPPFTYYPQHRSEYRVTGYIPTSGRYSISESSVLVSFPNPGKDFISGRALGTGSMQPFFGAGATLIENEGFTTTDIAVGDIVVWEDPTDKQRVVHQVIKVLSDGVVTKGFNNLKDDGLIPWASLRSLVVGVIF